MPRSRASRLSFGQSFATIGGIPAEPGYGTYVTAVVAITSGAGGGAEYVVYGEIYQAGTTTLEGHMGSTVNPVGVDTWTPATGNIAGDDVVAVTLYSGAWDLWVNGYGFDYCDVVFTLTGGSGAAVTVSVPNAIKLPQTK